MLDVVSEFPLAILNFLILFSFFPSDWVFSITCPPNHWFNPLLHLIYCWIFLVYFSFELLYFIFLIGSFICFLCLFLCLLFLLKLSLSFLSSLMPAFWIWSLVGWLPLFYLVFWGAWEGSVFLFFHIKYVSLFPHFDCLSVFVSMYYVNILCLSAFTAFWSRCPVWPSGTASLITCFGCSSSISCVGCVYTPVVV